MPFHNEMTLKTSADIVYFCFSLVNRSSFNSLQKVGFLKRSFKKFQLKKVNFWGTPQKKKFQRILVGTQKDVRNWFEQEKKV